MVSVALIEILVGFDLLGVVDVPLVEVSQAHTFRAIATICRSVRSPAAVTVADAVAPMMSAPSFWAVTVTLPATEGVTVMEALMR